MKKLKVVMVAAALTAFIAAPVMAQTPDGLTPANEDVCDELIGATPGLYGLCVGFCEAQDCEANYDFASGEVTFDPSCKPSSNRLLENYNKRAQPGDPPMPCVNVVEAECRCWTQSELEQVADNVTEFCGAPLLGFDAVLIGIDGSGGVTDAAIADTIAFGEPACFYLENTPTLVFLILPLELEELLTCITTIENECAARGF